MMPGRTCRPLASIVISAAARDSAPIAGDAPAAHGDVCALAARRGDRGAAANQQIEAGHRALGPLRIHGHRRLPPIIGIRSRSSTFIHAYRRSSDAVRARLSAAPAARAASARALRATVSTSRRRHQGVSGAPVVARRADDLLEGFRRSHRIGMLGPWRIVDLATWVRTAPGSARRSQRPDASGPNRCRHTAHSARGRPPGSAGSRRRQGRCAARTGPRPAPLRRRSARRARREPPPGRRETASQEQSGARSARRTTPAASACPPQLAVGPRASARAATGIRAAARARCAAAMNSLGAAVSRSASSREYITVRWIGPSSLRRTKRRRARSDQASAEPRKSTMMSHLVAMTVRQRPNQCPAHGFFARVTSRTTSGVAANSGAAAGPQASVMREPG